VPVRVLNRQFWHQGAAGRELLSFVDPARWNGRYTTAGGSGAWYGSSTERGAWAELFRHHLDDELSPFEIRRRVGRVSVSTLRVLDLTDGTVCARLGLTEAALIADDTTTCRQVAALAQAAGLDGVLAPAAALPGGTTLVVFTAAMNDSAKVAADHSRVQAPPVSLLQILHRIRSVPEAPAAVRALFARLVLSGRDAIRRSRRDRP